MSKVSFTVKLLVFSALVFLLAFIVAQNFGINVWCIISLSVFFTAFSFMLNSQLQKSLQAQNKNQFTHTFLGLTALKMFGSLVFLLIGLYFSSTESRLALGICTMSYYMLYTILEVWHWVGKLKS